ncbi:hypothetical protein NDU88_004803 [Pleurodeles waltl]|uniref:Uncharacterized protein n=1 Tax=Pleurodeles waltl TaxID=8319 RepID=A0AAV7WXQ6_PLEWA|nr:hypothetical protein NDU88_004803 [Pleurodeles waltl]
MEPETLTPQQAASTAELEDLHSQLHLLHDSAEVCIIGLPEGMEGSSAMLFIKNWLRTKVAPRVLLDMFTMERMQMMPKHHPPPGVPSTPIRVRILMFRDHNAMLQKAKENALTVVDNTNVSFFPDYTLAVQRTRPLFLVVKNSE